MFGLARKKKSGRATRKTKSRSRKAKKSAKRKGGNKKAFGGYSINFAGRQETVEQVFGRGDLPPSQMTKRLWKYVKAKRLASSG